jgi:hypothetical protein
MSPFHSGMNHWQRQWLSDRLHKKTQEPPAPTLRIDQPVAKPKRRKPAKAKESLDEQDQTLTSGEKISRAPQRAQQEMKIRVPPPFPSRPRSASSR